MVIVWEVQHHAGGRTIIVIIIAIIVVIGQVYTCAIQADPVVSVSVRMIRMLDVLASIGVFSSSA